MSSAASDQLRRELDAMEVEAHKLGKQLGYSDDEIERRIREAREAIYRRWEAS